MARVGSFAVPLGAVLLTLGVAILAGRAALRVGPVGAPADARAWIPLAAGGAFGPAERVPLAVAGPSGVEAESAVLMDAASGRVLYAKAPYRRMYPASIAKIMTAYAVVHHLQAQPGGVAQGLDQLVRVSAQAAGQEGSSAYLHAGERVSVRDLLYGLLLASGNDAAEALAEYVSGSRFAFAALCDRLAANLGAGASSFANPSGLPAATQYTTAYDMALITRAALADPVIAGIVATRRYTATLADGRSLTYHNENRLLGEGGVDGVKTGYTTQAGQTYVASASRDGLRLIAVVLRSSRWGKYQDAKRLFAWGFAALQPASVVPAGRAAQQVQVAGGTARYVDLLPAPDAPTAMALMPAERLAIVVRAPVVVAAPVRQGSMLGAMTVYVDGRPFGRWPLRTAWGVPRAVGRGLRAVGACAERPAGAVCPFRLAPAA